MIINKGTFKITIGKPFNIIVKTMSITLKRFPPTFRINNNNIIKETTHTTETLKAIDHGDTTIMLEYGNHVFTALFIKGNQTSEIRAQLKKLIKCFESMYSDVLGDWDGDLRPFKDKEKLVSEIFQEA